MASIKRSSRCSSRMVGNCAATIASGCTRATLPGPTPIDSRASVTADGAMVTGVTLRFLTARGGLGGRIRGQVTAQTWFSLLTLAASLCFRSRLSHGNMHSTVRAGRASHASLWYQAFSADPQVKRIMKILLVHPDDSVEVGPWAGTRCDLAIDLGWSGRHA